jgi:deazaflavin-dependent oxidoreductase (nitroreductase family)
MHADTDGGSDGSFNPHFRWSSKRVGSLREAFDSHYNERMDSPLPAFRKPTTVEKLFNRTSGFLVGLGLGPSHIYLLQVRGRKTGKIFSTPVDLLELQGKRYLVAPRGQTQWVRNAEAAGEVRLKKGSTLQKFRLRAIPDAEKPQILKAYLDSFKREVQRYFSIPAGSPPEQFAPIAASYPAFELLAD